MEWPQNPPLPMMLAVDAQPAGNWEIPDVYGTLNANKVHRDLQFLAISRGSPPIQVLGGDWLRAGHLGSLLAYGQAEVFNPKDWYMFDQNWRARLTRASLLERKLQDVSSKLGLPAGGVVPSILRQVNLH